MDEGQGRTKAAKTEHTDPISQLHDVVAAALGQRGAAVTIQFVPFPAGFSIAAAPGLPAPQPRNQGSPTISDKSFAWVPPDLLLPLPWSESVPLKQCSGCSGTAGTSLRVLLTHVHAPSHAFEPGQLAPS